MYHRASDLVPASLIGSTCGTDQKLLAKGEHGVDDEEKYHQHADHDEDRYCREIRLLPGRPRDLGQLASHFTIELERTAAPRARNRRRQFLACLVRRRRLLSVRHY